MSEQWALQVNECAIFATVRAADWWCAWRPPMDRIGRITTLKATLGGELVSVACDSKDDATWLQGHMTEQGIPARALKVTRPRSAA